MRNSKAADKLFCIDSMKLLKFEKRDILSAILHVDANVIKEYLKVTKEFIGKFK